MLAGFMLYFNVFSLHILRGLLLCILNTVIDFDVFYTFSRLKLTIQGAFKHGSYKLLLRNFLNANAQFSPPASPPYPILHTAFGFLLGRKQWYAPAKSSIYIRGTKTKLSIFLKLCIKKTKGLEKEVKKIPTLNYWNTFLKNEFTILNNFAGSLIRSFFFCFFSFLLFFLIHN